MRTARIVIGCLVGAALLVTPAHADLWIESYRECSGTAPTVSSCTTFTHLRTIEVAHGFHLTGAYTGTLESRLEWLLGTHTFRCSYIGSVRQGNCVEEGTFPLPATLYRHACNSFDFHTATPGGSGPWKCFTAHSTGLFATDITS